MTNTKDRRYLMTLYSRCKTRAQHNLGFAAWTQLGPVLRRALIADEILILVDQQDRDGVSDATVRDLVTGLRELLTDDPANN